MNRINWPKLITYTTYFLAFGGLLWLIWRRAQ